MDRRPLERSARILAALGLAALVVALSFKRLGDLDLPWHLALGRWMSRVGHLPRIDDLSYTARPIAYADVLWDRAAYALMRLGPFALQLGGAIVAGALAFVLWLRARAAGPVALLVVALSMAALEGWLLVRPATTTFLLIAIVGGAIEAHRAGTRWPLLTLVPLHALWSNVHGAAFVGVLMLAAYAAHRALSRVLRRGIFPAGDAGDAGLVAAIAVAAGVATTFNRAGLRYFTGPLQVAPFMAGITEWARPTPTFVFATVPLVGVFAVLAVVALAVGREESRLPRGYELAILALAAVFFGTALRLIPMAIVLVTPLVARRLGPLVPNTRAMNVACGFATLLVAPFMLLAFHGGPGVGFAPDHFPERAVAYVRAARPAGHMWNFSPFGGYLAWELHPEHRVFIDGRAQWVYGIELTERAWRSERDPAAFAELARTWDFQWAVCRVGGDACAHLAATRAWTMVHLDDRSTVYVRNDGPNAHLARDGYRLVRHTTPPEVALRIAVTGAPGADELSHDGALARRQDPTSPRATLLDACGAIAARDEARFRDALEHLARLRPGHPAVGALRGAWSARMAAP